MEIQYAIVRCPLGRLLVALTERGIASVYLGDSERRLSRELAREFPSARIRKDGEGLGEAVDAIVGYLRGQRPAPALRLDVRATAFQRRVWEELRRIPGGETRSYSQIARAIGKPTAARAVARACATNPAAIVIPCHRVVGKNGSLTGYRWGTERKRALLDMEARANQVRSTRALRPATKSRSHQNAQPEMAQVSTISAKRFAEIK
jgi:AraC family transcriptional regulator of adaptative response/methylated-DNA-[protein]-cysteine methyltransferase